MAINSGTQKRTRSAPKPAAPTLINHVCRINRCHEPARYNFVIVGHPNGDVACSYCWEHAKQSGGIGHWDESPTPYTITITGPIAARGRA